MDKKIAAQMKYFRSLADKAFDVPGKGPRIFKATTMKGWLNSYKKKGFKAIVPSLRCDLGAYRKIDSQRQEELWTGDFMHGPQVSVVKGSKKAILFAVIDDHS